MNNSLCKSRTQAANQERPWGPGRGRPRQPGEFAPCLRGPLLGPVTSGQLPPSHMDTDQFCQNFRFVQRSWESGIYWEFSCQLIQFLQYGVGQRTHICEPPVFGFSVSDLEGGCELVPSRPFFREPSIWNPGSDPRHLNPKTFKPP